MIGNTKLSMSVKTRKLSLKGLSLILLSVLVLASCHTVQPITDEQIQSLLDEYENQSELLRQRRDEERARGVIYLEVKNGLAQPSEQLVSVHLDNAYLDVVIDRLGIGYTLMDGASLSRRVTTKFQDLPMQQALDTLLAPAALRATLGEQLVTISPRIEVELELAADDDYVFHKKRMRYADTRALAPILELILWSGDDEDDDDDDSPSPAKRLTFAAIHAENAILVKGPSAEVRNALELLNSLDTDTGHILIEALVLEFSASHLLDIGTRISNGATGDFSEIGIDWGSMIGETIAFTNVAGAANTRAFRAAINMLIEQDYARVIARPYLATVSGTQASIQVVVDRYVTTFSPTSDEITLEPVTSGVILTVMPFQLPDEQIRMDLSITLSRFVPTLENVSLIRVRNEATSTVRIGAGETVVIGGMMAEQSTNSKSGVPGLRSVPGLGFLFGGRRETSNRARLLIYITPYLWEPGLETPIKLGPLSDEFARSPVD